MAKKEDTKPLIEPDGEDTEPVDGSWQEDDTEPQPDDYGAELPEEDEDMDEQEPTASSPRGREALAARLAERYPDRDFTNDDDLYDQVGTDYDDYDTRLKEYGDETKRLTDMMDRDPRAAAFLADWADGADPIVALVRRYGTEIRDILDDPEKQDEMAEANRQFMERAEQNGRMEEEYKTNLSQSLAQIEQLQQERGLSDDDVDKAMAMLVGIAQDAIVGKFAPSTVELALKAVNHDQDVAEAQQQGQVQGRNARIAETLRRPESTDGVPMMNGSNNRQGRPKPPSIFDLAAEA